MTTGTLLPGQANSLRISGSSTFGLGHLLGQNLRTAEKFPWMVGDQIKSVSFSPTKSVTSWKAHVCCLLKKGTSRNEHGVGDSNVSKSFGDLLGPSPSIAVGRVFSHSAVYSRKAAGLPRD